MSCLPNADFSQSIVAVHGLGATPSTTWAKAPALQENLDRHTEPSTTAPPTRANKFEDRINWLSNPKMLPADVTNARIMTFNYDSNWYGDDAVKVRLDHVADDLRRKILRQRRVNTIHRCISNANKCCRLTISRIALHGH